MTIAELDIRRIVDYVVEDPGEKLFFSNEALKSPKFNAWPMIFGLAAEHFVKIGVGPENTAYILSLAVVQAHPFTPNELSRLSDAWRHPIPGDTYKTAARIVTNARPPRDEAFTFVFGQTGRMLAGDGVNESVIEQTLERGAQQLVKARDAQTLNSLALLEGIEPSSNP